MYETWKATFESEGQVTLRHSRKTGFWLLMGGLGFAAAGLYLLTMPLRSGFASFFGTAAGRAAGGVSGLFGLALIVGALAFFLVRPGLIVKLDEYGVTPGRGLPVAWDEITGVSLRRVSSMTLPIVRVSDSYMARAAEQYTGWQARLWRITRAYEGPNRVSLQASGAAPATDIQRLILWARDYVRDGTPTARG